MLPTGQRGGSLHTRLSKFDPFSPFELNVSAVTVRRDAGRVVLQCCLLLCDIDLCFAHIATWYPPDCDRAGLGQYPHGIR